MKPKKASLKSSHIGARRRRCTSIKVNVLDKIIQLERYEQRSRRRRERAITQWLLTLETYRLPVKRGSSASL